ncbi:MAG: hypothetical protein ACLVD8_03185 [Enterocloster sp.]|uniref:hypothetical protein n=1 Tax=Enterocloster sp. TaxID=2719315 RepID=UPI003999748E
MQQINKSIVFEIGISAVILATMVVIAGRKSSDTVLPAWLLPCYCCLFFAAAYGV